MNGIGHMEELHFRDEILDCKILLVEDDYVGRMTLRKIMEKHGFRNVEVAEDGLDGYEKLLKFRPDLVITDIQMPRMDGFELCRRIRADADAGISGIPILVQTGLTEASEKAKLFSLGASDYVSKPIDPQEIAARCNVHLERELMMRRLRDYNLRVCYELEVAKFTQRMLLPVDETIREISRMYHLEVHEHFQTCSELGGDFWGIKSLSTDVFSLHAVDFSGHGVNAALNVFRLHALMHSALSVAHTPSAYMTHLNAILASLLPVEQFATMFYGVVDTKRNTLAYTSAASPMPIMLRGAGGYEILDSSGLLLGTMRDTIYQTREVSFEPGDCLLLYSDALIETQNASGALLSLDDIIGFFEEGENGTRLPYGMLFQNLLEHFNAEYMPRLKDDLTLVACHRIAD